MSFPRNSLSAFLKHSKQNLVLALKGSQKATIVVGNESADLDSLTTSLLYAYTRSLSPPKSAFSQIYIPLLNLPRSAIRLRPEFTSVCSHGGFATSSLLTLTDIQSGFSSPEKVRWILVDHNKLQGHLGQQFSQYVTGVIDHHDEENTVPRDTDPEPRIVEKAGSCTSLVVRYCRQTWDAISASSLSSGAAHGQGESAVDDEAVTRVWDAQVAKIALASILVDTANLRPPGRVEQVDRDAVEYLEGRITLIPREAKGWDRERFFKELQGAKGMIEGLMLGEILKKDYKMWSEGERKLGISSVVKDLRFLIKKAEAEGGKSGKHEPFVNVLDRLMDEEGLEISAIMTTSTTDQGDFQRELLVQARPSAHESVKRFLETAVKELELEEMNMEAVAKIDSPSADVWRKIYRHKELSKGRKQVAPLLRDAMKG